MRGESDVDEAGPEETTHVFAAEAVAYGAETVDAHFRAHAVDDGLDDRVDSGGRMTGEPTREVEVFELGYSGEVSWVACVVEEGV